jgi:hypothetical protein
MPEIRYVNDDGETVQEEVLSRRVTFFEGSLNDDDITVDNGVFDTATVSDDVGQFRPAVVERSEFDHEGKMSSLTSVCGETENRRETDEKPRLIVEGILVEDQLPQFREIQRANELTMVADIYQGQVEVKRVTLEQTTDIIEFIPDGGDPQLAFPFQLQLRKP